MSASEKYTAAAYLVVFAVVLLYMLIIAVKLARLERELRELTELAVARRQQPHAREEVEEVRVG